VNPYESILRKTRASQRYVRGSVRGSFEKAALMAAFHRCDQIGLQLGGNGWEYPVWVEFTRALNRQPRIEHYGVQNVSASLAPQDFTPCLILESRPDRGVVARLVAAEK